MGFQRARRRARLSGGFGGWAQDGRRAAESAASPEACRGTLRVGEQATKAAVSWQIWHVRVVAGAAAGGGQQLEVGVYSNWGRRGVGMRGKSDVRKCRHRRDGGARMAVVGQQVGGLSSSVLGIWLQRHARLLGLRVRGSLRARRGHGPLHPASMCTACIFGGKRFSLSCACACPREMAG